MTLSTPPEEVAGHGPLSGKVVVVTAAAGTGIGSATARRALLGADVMISRSSRATPSARRGTRCPRWVLAGSRAWSAT